jgi:hypothetical protein
LKGLGGKEETGIDIVLRQARILFQDLLHGSAMGQESQDVLYGKSCALDDGFAYHYFGIYGDPFQKIFIIHEDAIGCYFDINVRIDLKETKLKATGLKPPPSSPPVPPSAPRPASPH